MYKAKNLYDIGRKQGYEEGWAKGYETARDSSIETICDALVMMFAEEGWTEDAIQEVAERLTHGVRYAWQFPEDFAEKRRSVFNQYGIEISYDGEKK